MSARLSYPSVFYFLFKQRLIRGTNNDIPLPLTFLHFVPIVQVVLIVQVVRIVQVLLLASTDPDAPCRSRAARRKWSRAGLSAPFPSLAVISEKGGVLEALDSNDARVVTFAHSIDAVSSPHLLAILRADVAAYFSRLRNADAVCGIVCVTDWRAASRLLVSDGLHTRSRTKAVWSG